MGLEGFEPIFGETRAECSAPNPSPLRPFLFYVHASGSSALRFHATDFHSRTFEAVRTVEQLEDMREMTGIVGSWSEFMDYVRASIKSDDVKLILEGHPGREVQTISNVILLTHILDTNRLIGPNFLDWFRNLKILLSMEKIDDVLYLSPPQTLPEGVTDEERVTWEILKDHDLRARTYILASMSNDLQRQHENMPNAMSMIHNLRDLFGKYSRTARYEISKKLFQTKMMEGSDVRDHVINMINWIGQLDELDVSINPHLRIDLILQSLPDSFSSFITFFYMYKIECSLPELLNRLTMVQSHMQGKGKEGVLAVASSSSQKKNKKKKKKVLGPQRDIGKTKSKGKEVAGKGKCFFCQNKGHWKRNCLDYLRSLKVKRQGGQGSQSK